MSVPNFDFNFALSRVETVVEKQAEKLFDAAAVQMNQEEYQQALALYKNYACIAI